MKLYRISPEPYLESYGGLGASYKDGARWNKQGSPVIYFALSAATALLEMANYLPSPRLVPASYRLGIYQVPKGAEMDEISDKDLPPDWASFPYPVSTQNYGSEWLASNKTLGLLVPSTAVPMGLEQIAVINPLHPQCQKIKLIKTVKELYNKRSFDGI